MLLHPTAKVLSSIEKIGGGVDACAEEDVVSDDPPEVTTNLYQCWL